MRALEQQVSQLTSKISALHSHHKSALIEVQEQTRHACDESHARHLKEFEERSKLDISLAKQVVEDQLESERAFHTAVDEKMASLQAMFPDMIETPIHQRNELSSSSLATAMASGVDSRHPHHPNSASRLHLNSFFEQLRRALNAARHTSSELRVAEREASTARSTSQQLDDMRYASDKSIAAIQRTVDAFTSDGDRARAERDAILERMKEIQQTPPPAISTTTIQPKTEKSLHSLTPNSRTSSSTNSDRPSSSTKRSPQPPLTSSTRPSVRVPSVKRIEQEEDDEDEAIHESLDSTNANAAVHDDPNDAVDQTLSQSFHHRQDGAPQSEFLSSSPRTRTVTFADD